MRNPHPSPGGRSLPNILTCRWATSRDVFIIAVHPITIMYLLRKIILLYVGYSLHASSSKSFPISGIAYNVKCLTLFGTFHRIVIRSILYFHATIFLIQLLRPTRRPIFMLHYNFLTQSEDIKNSNYYPSGLWSIRVIQIASIKMAITCGMHYVIISRV